MEKMFLTDLLLKMKEDFEKSRFYREDSVKAGVYHHLRKILPEKYIYTEINYKWVQSKKGWLFDLVVSEKPFSNWEKLENQKTAEITWFDWAIAWIEIKYINQKKAKKPDTNDSIIEAIINDGNKLKDSNIKDKKIVFFVYEYYNIEKNPLEDIMNNTEIKQLIENWVTICWLYWYYTWDGNEKEWEYKIFYKWEMRRFW